MKKLTLVLAFACAGLAVQAQTTPATTAPTTTSPAPAPATADAPTGNLVETASANPDFSTLVAAIQAAGLAETLSGKGPFTVFAPTNAAFAALPAGTLDELLKPENKEKLASILTYHVVKGSVKAASLRDGQKPKTVNGKELMVSMAGGRPSINGARVVKPNVMATNGVIHVVDQVLMPPAAAGKMPK